MDTGWRVANNALIDDIVATWTRTNTRAEALNKLDATEIACSPVNDIADILKWQHLRDRQMLQPLHGPGSDAAQGALAAGFPLRLSDADVGYHRPAPMPRANNEEIYTGLLNLSPADQEELAKAGVI